MASDEVDRPYEEGLALVRRIAQENVPLLEKADRIYGVCKGCDRTLAALPSDFKINSNYHQVIHDLCAVEDAAKLAAACRTISGMSMAARALTSIPVSPAKRPRELSEEQPDERRAPPSRWRDDERTTRSQAAKKPYAFETETGSVQLDPYLTFTRLAGSGEPERIATQFRRCLRLIFQGQEDGRWKLWDPKAWGDAGAQTLERISGLNLTLLPYRDVLLPDMTTHLLGNLETLDPDIPARLDQLLAEHVQSLYVKNASGTGKTRAFFEVLTRQWGLYFVCFWHGIQDPYGSRDVHEALQLLAAGTRNSPMSEHFFTPLEGLSGESAGDSGKSAGDAGKSAGDAGKSAGDAGKSAGDPWAAQRKHNNLIAEHIFSIVLLARVLALDIFLKEWNSFANKANLSLAQKRRDGLLHWCRLQIYPDLDSIGDIFHVLTVSLLRVKPLDAQKCSRSTVQTWKSLYGEWFSLKLVVLDEAQEATSRWPESFAAGVSGTTRPVLRPLVMSVTKWLGTTFTFKVFIGATKLGDKLVTDAVATALGKLKLEMTAFDALGDQSASSRIRATLSHFFGPEYVERIPSELMSEIQFWLSGRHRFLALFVQFCLSEGPGFGKMSNVLWNIVARLTGHRISAAMVDIPSMTLAPILSPKLLREPQNERDKEKHKQEVVRLAVNLLDIVTRLIIGREFPTLGAEDLEVVTLGVGRIRPVVTKDSLIHVNEPLILTAVVGWVNHHLPMVPDIDAAVKQKINDWFDTKEGGVKGHGNEDLVIYLLWRKFSAPNGEQLDKVFAFEYLRPEWAGRRAKLLSISSRFSPTKKAEFAPETLVTPLVFQAWSEGETLAWFRHQKKPYFAFLKPDQPAAPDIILVLLLETGEEIIILIQCKCWQGENQTAVEKVEEALFKLSPEGLYKGNSAEKAQRRATIRAELSRLSTTGLTMRPQPTVPVTNASTPYEAGNATIPLVRVFAAFKGSHAEVDVTKNLGAYPFAYLADDFVEFGAVEFPAFKVAMEHARTMQPRKKSDDSADVASAPQGGSAPGGALLPPPPPPLPQVAQGGTAAGAGVAPGGGAQRGAAPGAGAQWVAAPQGGAPRGGVPPANVPRGGAPQRGAPRGGAPQGGTPRGGAPQGAAGGGARPGGAQRGGGQQGGQGGSRQQGVGRQQGGSRQQGGGAQQGGGQQGKKKQAKDR